MEERDKRKGCGAWISEIVMELNGTKRRREIMYQKWRIRQGAIEGALAARKKREEAAEQESDEPNQKPPRVQH